MHTSTCDETAPWITGKTLRHNSPTFETEKEKNVAAQKQSMLDEDVFPCKGTQTNFSKPPR